MTLDQIGEIRDNIDDALIEQDSKSIDKFNECKPFIDSALDFVNVCSYLDEQEELDAKLLEKFDISKKKVSESVDEMKDFLAEIDSKINLAKKKAEEATKAKKKFENLRERLVQVIKSLVLANPSIPFQDSLGKKLKVIPNPQPSLKLKNSTDWEISEYAKIVSKLELDKESLKKDLLDGKEVAFAHLEYSTQLRGLK